MARPVPEWVGKTETSRVPDPAWQRVLEKHGWRCAHCQRPHTLVKKFEQDHIVALVNWTGALPHGNREFNLQPLCESCHKLKSKKDVALKALATGHKKMRTAYKRAENPHGFKAKRERLKLKYNWAKGRYEQE